MGGALFGSPKIISGTHTVTQKQVGLRYMLRGRAVSNSVGQFHLIYRARLVGSNEEDGYVFSGYASSQREFESACICGIWHGVLTEIKQTKAPSKFRPGAGFAVISKKELDVESLNELASGFQKEQQESISPIWTADRIISD